MDIFLKILTEVKHQSSHAEVSTNLKDLGTFEDFCDIYFVGCKALTTSLSSYYNALRIKAPLLAEKIPICSTLKAFKIVKILHKRNMFAHNN